MNDTAIENRNDAKAAEDSPPAIEVKHVTVSYGPTPAILDVSFQVEPGSLIGIIGPNGSGKSTLIKTILGFKRPDIGEVLLFGEQSITRKAELPTFRNMDRWIGSFPLRLPKLR